MANSAPIPPTPARDDAESSASSRPLDARFEAGETTLDDKLAFEVEIACYQQMKALIRVMRARIDERLDIVEPKAEGEPPEPVHIVFLDNALRAAFDIASTVEVQLSTLKGSYAGAAETANGALRALLAPVPTTIRRLHEFSALPELASVGAVAPSAAMDAAVALIGALRTDTRYSGRQVVVPDYAFALALARAWDDSAVVQFHYPTLFAPPTKKRKELMEDVVKALDAVLQERKTASEAVSSLMARVSQLGAATPEFLAAKPSLDTARDQFDAAETVFEAVSSQLSKADERSGLTQLQLLERAAFVATIAKEAPKRTFYLFAQVVSAGGAFRIVRNFFRSLVKADGLEHAGGCVVTFGLFDEDGRLRASDTIGSRSSYTDSLPPLDVLEG